MRLVCIGDVALCGQSDVKKKLARPLAHVDTKKPARILFNWEFPCADICVGEPRVSGSLRCYVAPVDAVRVIANWSPAVAGLANNHLMDGGVKGVIQTVERIKEYGVDIVGGGALQRMKLLARGFGREQKAGRCA